MPTKSFLTSRKIGEKAQHYVAGMFKSWNLNVAQTPRGYRPNYDMIVSGTLHGIPLNFKAEIKYDVLSAKTGNIYLDISSLRKSQASILLICLNDPIDTVLMLPLAQVFEYALKHRNITGGEFKEHSACISRDQFIQDLKPQVLTTKK